MSKQEILDAPVKLVEYHAVEAGLAGLRKDLAGVQFDVTTTEGNKAARAARQRCVSIRTSADAAYSDWNKPMLDKQRAMRAKLAEIKDAVKEVEEPIDAQIKAEEQRKAEEKAKREAEESARQKALQDRIDAIKFAPSVCAGQNSEALAGAIKGLQATEITLDEYGDRAGEAEIAKRNALAQMEEIHTAALAHEAEQAKMAAERAELQRQREEQAKRDAEAKAKADAEEAARKAEIAKQEAELKAQQDAIDRQKQELADAQAAAERKEQARLAAIEAEAQATRDAEAKAAKDKADAEAAAAQKKADDDAAEAARRERIQFEKNGPGDAAIIETLALHYRVHESTVVSWLVAMDMEAASKELLKEFA